MKEEQERKWERIETRMRNWKGGKRGRERSEGKERKENMYCDSLATGYIREKEDMTTDVC